MITASISKIDSVVQELIEKFAETAGERDKKGGTAKEQRDLIRASGLLSLLTPENLGGEGYSWGEILEITKRFAQVDSSIAHLFGYHFLCLATVDLYGNEQQFNNYAEKTAQANLFWGNAFNPLDKNVVATKTETGWLINGVKSFCSGSSDSDLLLISAQKEQGEGTLIAIIPTKRIGIIVEDNWNSFGQRQTDSGSVQFNDVEILAHEVLTRQVEDPSDLKPTIRTHLAQSILNQVLLGTAQGAFAEAKDYTQTMTRAWLTSDVERAVEDPYYIQTYGEFYVKLKASASLNQIATEAIQVTWENRNDLTLEERGLCSIAVATAKVQIAQTALEVTSKMFEVMGARATSANYNFDRYWRNVRTHTLHDPLDYKIRDLGDFALNNKYPEISPYS